LLQHGKESPKTQEKIVAWVSFLFDKLQQGLGQEVVKEVVEECLSAPFQRFVPFMEEQLMERVANGLGEHLFGCDEDTQKKVMESFSAIPDRIEKIMVTCTKELNSWLAKAPRFPSTPLTLVDTLQKLQQPLIRFFNRIKDASKKESFLVAVALALQTLRTRFRWMCMVEPSLEEMGAELQSKLFTVEGQLGPVMEMWLSSRLQTYNKQVIAKAGQVLMSDSSGGKQLELKNRLQPLFPERIEGDLNSGWVALDGPSRLADALLNWLSEQDSDFFCPQHTVAQQTLISMLQRFGRSFEIDPIRARVRCGHVEPPVPPPAVVLPKAQFPPLPPPVVSETALAIAPVSGPPVMVPPPAVIPGTAALQSVGTNSQLSTPSAPVLKLPGASISTDGNEVDNLVDLLLNEALAPVSSEIRAKISKLGHGIYRFGEKEVTLHTSNGRLFVYRVGMIVRNCPLQTLLQEEGLVPGPAPAVPATSSTSASAVDTSSVARIASLGAQISSGVAMKTATGQQISLPFGLSRPPEQKSDPKLLTSKRVEAATRAMDVAIQFARRSIDFDDEKFLRKLLAKGLKHDEQWSAAYADFCATKGIVSSDHKKHDKDAVASFIERNLASSINEHWAKKVIYGANDEDKKEKKYKKEKKKDKKEKKDKKRKVSESGSSSPEREFGDSMVAPPQVPMPPVMQPPSMPPPSMQPPPMDMAMGMPMYPPGMLSGMMGHMGMGGMFPPGMMGDAMMPQMTMEEERPRKKAKLDKADKPKKAEKASKNKR
jgi:hypothetical protein